MAIRHAVPFIAIDQIAGGAKLLPLLSGLNWDAVYGVDTVEEFDITSVALELLNYSQADRVNATRFMHVREANRTLAHLDLWLESVGTS